jgi:hypothetical protein
MRTATPAESHRQLCPPAIFTKISLHAHRWSQCVPVGNKQTNIEYIGKCVSLILPTTQYIHG